MQTYKKIFCVLAACIALAATAHGTEVVTNSEATLSYTGKPLHVLTPVGGERLIEFRRSVQVAVPRTLLDSITVESIAGMVYLRAKTSFSKERFRFRDMDSGEVFVLDISAVKKAPSTALVFSDNRNTRTIEENPVANESREEIAKPKATSKAELTRHVFQQVYSPDRLIQSLHDVQKISISNDAVVTMLIPGEEVRAKPLAQWKSDSGLYATAVQLLNTGGRDVVLDPRRLRSAGHWVTASYISGTLRPHGTNGDSMLLVVVGTKTWEDSTTWLR